MVTCSQPQPLVDLGELRTIHAEAARWLQERLRDSPIERGPRGYLARRGFPVGTVGTYRLGYAPPAWTALTSHLRTQGHDDEVIAQSGLAQVSRRSTLIDRFRDRLMFPICEPDGTVIAFTGRAAPGANTSSPKYLNSPTTPLYRKAETMYGLAEGAHHLVHGAVPVLVEGPLDAIAVTAAAAGRYVGVSPCGTALTAAQVRALDRLVPLAARGVIVASDGDAPGQAAAARSYEPLRHAGAWPGHARFPEGEDPASLLCRLGPAALTAALQAAHACPLVEAVVDQRIEPFRARLDTIEGRVLAARAAAPVLRAVPSAYLAGQIIRATQHLGLSLDTVSDEVRAVGTSRPVTPRTTGSAVSHFSASTRQPETLPAHRSSEPLRSTTWSHIHRHRP